MTITPDLKVCYYPQESCRLLNLQMALWCWHVRHGYMNMHKPRSLEAMTLIVLAFCEVRKESGSKWFLCCGSLVIKVYCYMLILAKANVDWEDLVWPKFMNKWSLHIDEYVFKAFQISKFDVFETNSIGAILMGLHIYWTILSDLCLEFMQIGDTPPNVDVVPYLGHVFNAIQI
jgi:hypothetical protein